MSDTSRAGLFMKSVCAALVATGLVVAGGGPFGAPVLEAQNLPALEARHQRLLPLFELNGVVFTDADETRGRLVVGVVNRGLEQSIRARLVAMGVPSESVDVVETEAIVPMTTLRDNVRPVVGGLQIRFSQYLCTLGFNATRNGVGGYVTAAHCSTKQGELDGTQYYQPLNQVQSEFVGTEIADPLFFKGKNGCPRGKRCRYSDANFSDGVDGSNTFDLGRIARTTGVNTGSLTLDGAFVITAKGAAALGASVDKVGRTTGWTRGTLTQTCANTGVSGTNIVLLCQNFVVSSAVIVGSGDSGSNVFTVNPVNDGTVTLRGTLWGGSSDGTLFVYSPIANVQQELGSLAVCAPGYGGC